MRHISRTRPGVGRRTPRALALVAALALTLGACGTEGGDGQAEDPATSSTSSSPSNDTGPPAPSTTPGTPATPGDSTGSRVRLPVAGTVEPGQAQVVSASDVAGDVAEQATPLLDRRGIAAFARTLDPRLGDAVRTAARGASVPPGSTLFGAVVSVGCQEPVAVSYETHGEVTAGGTPVVTVSATLPKQQVQCLVPVTSVALFLV